MKAFFKIFFITLVISIITCQYGVYAQTKSPTKKQLQSEQKAIEQKINYTKKLLDETKKNKNSSLNQLNLIQNQVNERTHLISSYSNEVRLIDNQIIFDQKSIDQLKKELKLLKEEYANLIYQSYKSRNNYDQWMFIMASKDFYQAMRRMKYLKEYSTYRRLKADEIVASQIKLTEEIAAFEKQKQERLGLLITKENEKQELEKDKRQNNQILRSLQEAEKDLKRQLNQQQADWNKLNKEIQRLIEKELAPPKGKSNERLAMSPADVQLSKDFAANIGKLPWPTQRGSITSHYGKHDHPQLHVVIDNKGVDFACEKGEVARAVFEGVVVKIIQLPRFKAVLIKHGDYFTVYNKLDQIFVTEGEKITTKQSLGTVWTDQDTGETVLHFELRKQIDPLNPENWLLK